MIKILEKQSNEKIPDKILDTNASNLADSPLKTNYILKSL